MTRVFNSGLLDAMNLGLDLSGLPACNSLTTDSLPNIIDHAPLLIINVHHQHHCCTEKHPRPVGPYHQLEL